MLPERVKSFVMADVSGKELQIGDRLDKPTLHITIVPPFTHRRIATADISRTIGAELGALRSFDVVAREETRAFNGSGWGRARKVGSYMLYAVHHRLVTAMEEHPEVEIDTSHALDDYMPHSSFKDGQGLLVNEKQEIDALYLMQKTDIAEMGPAWYVAAKYNLETE